MSYSVWLFLHHFTYLTLIPAILWHAQASWEYILPAVTIWFFDRLLRVYRNVKAVNLVSAQQASLSTGERHHQCNMFSPASIDPRFVTPDPIRSIHDHKSYQQEKIFFHQLNQQSPPQNFRTSSLGYADHAETDHKSTLDDNSGPLPVSPSFIHSISSITNVGPTTQPTQSQITSQALGGHNPAFNFSGPGVRIVDRGLAGQFIELRIINDHMVYFPGHYAFINIAEISLFEWHPFTIASPAHFCARSEIVFIIKSMGKGTWTQSLYDYVQDYYAQAQADPLTDFLDIPLTVSLDGPCGTPIDFSTYDIVILLAGGIGVTPCKSIYESLLLSYLHDFKSKLMLEYTQQQQVRRQQYSGATSQQRLISQYAAPSPIFLVEPNHNPILQNMNIPSVPLVETNKRIHLMWSARDLQLFDIMSESLSAIPYGPFSAALFCDNPASSEIDTELDAMHKRNALPESVQKLVLTGRPNLEEEFLHVVDGLNPNSYLSGVESGSNVGSNVHSSVSTYFGLSDEIATASAFNALEQSSQSRGPVDPTSSHHGGFINDNTKRVLIFACGPGPMAKDAQIICQKHGWDFHTETFEL